MKVKIEIDLTSEEFKELCVPGDKQSEFTMRVYDAYTKAFTKLVREQIDPHGLIWNNNGE